MESFGEKVRAYLYAFLVHLVVALSLIFGLFFADTAKPVATPGTPIEADIIGPTAAKPPRPTSKPRPEPPKPVAPAPAPEPPKPEPPKPPEVQQQPTPTVQHNDNRDQEKIAEVADQKAEQVKKAQEEKHRQQQIELDEEKKREEAEQKKAKQAEIQKQLEDIRKERDKAAKQTKLAQEKMKQLDDLQKQQAEVKKPTPADVPEADVPKTGMNGTDASLLGEYSSAIVKVVTDNWNRPDTAPAGVRCAVHIVQIRGGTVLSANIASPCNADPVTQESIKQAVTKAQPLPYKGYESVFQRDITFIFKYDGT